MISFIVLAIELLVISGINILFPGTIDDLVAGTFIFVFAVFYYIEVFFRNKYKKYRYQFCAAFSLRLFVLLFDLFGRSVYVLPHSGVDTENFYLNALRFARGARTLDTVTIKTFGMLVKLFGTDRLLIQFLLMLLSIITMNIVMATLEQLNASEKGTKIALWFIAIIPNYLIMSSLFLRESIIILLVAISIYSFAKWWKGNPEIWFVLSVLFSLIGAMYHSGIIGVSLGYVGVRFLYDRKTDKFKLTISSIFIVCASLLAFTYLYNNYSYLLFSKMQNVESLNDLSNGGGSGGSSYANIAGNSNSVLNFVLYSPWRILLFLITPLPFQIRGASDLIAMAFSAWAYLFIMFRGLINAKKKSRNRTIIIASLMVAFATSFIFGWGSTNIGTNIRHRDKLIPIFATVLALTYDNERNNAHNKDKYSS